MTGAEAAWGSRPRRRAVLLMAYGGPRSIEEVEPFLLDVRGGRATSRELVEEVEARYRAIGGASPLLERSREQARALESELVRGGGEWRVAVGMRHWHPYVRDAVRQFAEDGVDELVGLCLTPQESGMSVGAYFRALDDALEEVGLAPSPGRGAAFRLRSGQAGSRAAGAESSGGGATGSQPAVRRVRSWHDHPGFLDAVAGKVEEALRRFPDGGAPSGDGRGAQVLFTAHSLPESILREGDPYDRQVRETAAGVAARVAERTGRRLDWHVAYQSAGARAVPWLGPSLEESLERLAGEGYRSFLVAPVGFVSDHVEILYDLDVEAREQARRLGVQLERTVSLNDSPEFIAALADVVRSSLR